MADDGDQLNMGLAALNQEAGRRLTWDEQEVLGDPTWQRDTAGLRRPMGLGVHVYEVCPWEQAPSSHWAFPPHTGRRSANIQSLVTEAGKSKQCVHQ